MATNISAYETTKKSAEETSENVTSSPITGDKRGLDVAIVGGFAGPANYDAVVADYPSPEIEVYEFKTGGIAGTTVMTITVTYTDSTKALISTVERT